jgi:hypothetical protein
LLSRDGGLDAEDLEPLEWDWVQWPAELHLGNDSDNKAEYPIAFAGCFAVAAAQSRSTVIMTADPEFKNVEHPVDIEWLDG